MSGEQEALELTEQERVNLDEAARMLLGMALPPAGEPEEEEPEAA